MLNLKNTMEDNNSNIPKLTKIVKGNKAKYSHYCAGNIYYNIEVDGETYQFPISSVDVSEVQKDEFEQMKSFIEEKGLSKEFEEYKSEPCDGDSCEKESCECGNKTKTLYTLSEDLGTTNFEEEYNAMMLMRWIRKSIKKGEFIKIA